jgi:hypothetical protein
MSNDSVLLKKNKKMLNAALQAFGGLPYLRWFMAKAKAYPIYNAK